MSPTITRRGLLAGTSALLGASSAFGGALGAAPLRPPFVRTSGVGFTRSGEPYRISGTNMLYAAYLGAGAPTGNRDRLARELDRLGALGINNVRILGSSELSPLKNSVRPTFRDSSAKFNQTL